MQNNKLIGTISVLLLLGVFLPLEAKGEDTGVSGTNLEFYRPAIDPYGLFGVNYPTLLKPGQPFFAASQSFEGGPPFQISVNNTLVNLVDKIATTNLVAGLGINRLLAVAVDIPIHPYVREANFNTLSSFTTSSLGDIRAAMKFRLLSEGEKRPGLALLFTNSFPTGDESKFLGTSHMVPGVELIIGKDLPFARFAVNTGARFPEQKNVLGVNFNDQITYGLGAQIPFGFWDPLLSVVGEIRGHFAPDNVRILTAPIEFTVGLKKEFKNGFMINGGGGGAWNNAIGNPRYRAVVTIGWSPPVSSGLVKPQSGVKEEFLEKIRTTLYFSFARATPTWDSLQWLNGLVDLLKAHPEIQKIRIEGHTDQVGSHRANLRLSLKRAVWTRNYLVGKGLDSSRFEVEGFSEDRPASLENSPQGRMLNRRVEIMVPYDPL